MRFRELKSIEDAELLRLIKENKVTPMDACLLQLHRGWLDWPVKTGQDLAQFRNRYNLTQTELSLLLKVTPAAIGRWERLELLPANISILLTCLESLNLIPTLDSGKIEPFFEIQADSPLQKNKQKHPLPLSGQFLNSLTGEKENNSLLPTHRSMTAHEIRNLRESLNLSRKGFAQLLNVTTNTVDKWETEATTPSGTAVVLLNILLKKINKSQVEG